MIVFSVCLFKTETTTIFLLTFEELEEQILTALKVKLGDIQIYKKKNISFSFLNGKWMEKGRTLESEEF